MHRLTISTLSVLVVTLLLALSARAQTTFTWTATSSGDFSDGANWQGGVAPTSGSNLVFGAAPSLSVYLYTTFTAGDITFNGITNGVYLDGGDELTLNGNITTTAGSTYWGVFSLPVTLSSGNHTYTTNGADIYHFGSITGDGGIIKNGPGSLILTAQNTYTGGTVLNAGTLYVGSTYALGTGTVTINGGILALNDYYTSGGSFVLYNDFVLGANVSFGGYSDYGSTLTLGYTESTLAPASGVTTVNLNLIGDQVPLHIDGGMIDGSSATTYTFSGSDPYYLSGFNSYTGGTLVKSGATVYFEHGYSLPEEGLITAESSAYVGLADATVGADTYVARLDPAHFAGTIGFDGGGSFSGDIDLSGFSDTGIALGTKSSATLTGAITPNGTSYQFRSSGTLYLEGENPLSGDYDLTVDALDFDRPGLVVLGQTVPNTYTGATTVSNAGLIIDSQGALPEETSLSVSSGYLSVTDASGLSFADLISRIPTWPSSMSGALGIDSHDYINGISGAAYTYSGDIDMSLLNFSMYFGTVSNLIITGAITTGYGGLYDYQFTGYNGGQLRIDSALSGSKSVYLGLPWAYQDDSDSSTLGTVQLNSTSNTYTGSTILNSGRLILNGAEYLGTDKTLTVDVQSSNDKAYLATSVENVELTNDIVLSSGELVLEPYSGLTLSGTISGTGRLSMENNINSEVTFSGNNTYSGGSYLSGTVYATSDTAFGTGSVSLNDGASIVFSSTSPQIADLQGGYVYDTGDGYIYSSLELTYSGPVTLTINQTEDGEFGGTINQFGYAEASLIKTGSGTLTIDGSYDYYPYNVAPYSGGTTILEGKLIAGSSTALGTGTITLNGGSLGAWSGVVLTNPIVFGTNGGTLSGNGTFGTLITVGEGVVLDPGFSPGALTFSSGLTLASGGELDFQLQFATGTAGTGYDTVIVTGAPLDITALINTPFTIKLISLNAAGAAGDVSDFSSANSYSWTLFSSAEGITNFAESSFTVDTSGFTNSLDGGSFSLSATASTITLNFTPVPEPSTYALLAAGLGLAGLARWRRRRT